MRKFTASVAAVLLIAAGSVAVGTATASATVEVCVPSEAWSEEVLVTPAIPAVPEVPEVSHVETVVVTEAYEETVIIEEAYEEVVFDYWQRYSWTGGPHHSAEPPAFPSHDWQANVKGDPHNVGVEGAYWRSHGGHGKGDWFYLEVVTEVIYHEAVTEIIYHPEVTEEIVVIDQVSLPGVPEVPAVYETVYHDAVECPIITYPQPPIKISGTSSQYIDCETSTVITTSVKTTSLRTVWDEGLLEWVSIDDLVEELIDERPATVDECPVVVVEPPVVAPEAVVTPTTARLAETGGNPNLGPIWVAILVIGLGVVLTIMTKARRN